MDRWRLIPVRGRRCGVAPPDLAERVGELDGNWTVRLLAGKFLPSRLGGLAPASLSADERGELVELYGGDGIGEQVERALDVLQEAGYGRRSARERTERAHGARRTERLERVRGKLPRALAKRLPTSADTHREGRNDGEDVYGQVWCSRTLRAGHLAVVAAAGGIWHSRNPQALEYAATTAGELVQLLTGRVRVGGKDVRDVHRLLAELEDLELSATVNPPPAGGIPRQELEIPGGPIDRIERRLPDGRWVDQMQYAEALAGLGGEEAIVTARDDAEADAGDEGATIRIYLAAWVREEIAHGRPTLIDFRVWAHLRPVGQRLYTYLQASHRDSYDQAIQFYLGPPLRYTLGLHGRQHRAAASVRAALAQLYAADVRYHGSEKWSVRGRWANTNLPAFRIAPRRRPSAPSERVRERRKCPGERPAALRGLSLREAREQTELVRQALVAGHGSPPASRLWPPGWPPGGSPRP